MGLRLVVKVISLLIRQPRLWGTAFVQVVRTAESDWWKRPPFFPKPADSFIEFRSKTQYGSVETDQMQARDILVWLEWVKKFSK
ncbi:MAG: hypothetical protein CL512_04745 [Actinobacteria bacterium]|nr:hypothetical protein [Actinomycetota bacterium]|tara:strand:- start:105 stop:356 length:252 start_codon:yes stop_codon:yes gene_type:complete